MQPNDRIKFMLAGNATFTIVSKKTGVRFTYNVFAKNDMHFVKVLTGPDTYSFLGTIFNGLDYRHGRKSQISEGAPSALAFHWFMAQPGTDSVEFFHAGKCGRCGRELTVPESIESGLGPECSRRVG